MPRSPWSVAAEALITACMLLGPPLLASMLGWPLAEHTSWTWLWQYLRGGTVPADAVIAAVVVLLWGAWAAYLLIIALDILALLRGLVPRVGLVRLVWVLMAGGTTALSTQTAAVAAHTHAVAEAPVRAAPGPQEEHTAEDQDQESAVIERSRTLSGFAFDSADLASDKKESLEPTIELLEAFAHPDRPVVVTGHTDPVGDPAYNQTLSEERAQQVADYLRHHLGEEIEIQVEGAGHEQPPAASELPHQAHRRVEIAYSLHKPAEPPAAQATQEEPPTDTEPLEGEDADPVSTHEPGESGALAVAATGLASVVGGAAGYAAGRRRGATPAARSQKPALHADVDADGATAEHGPPSTGLAERDLTRHDPEGIARGVIDEDGYVLVAETLRVNGRSGLSFTGPHAAHALAALAADHTTARTIATSAAAEAIAGSDGALPLGVYTVADVHGAQIAVDAELLAAARSADEEPELQAGTRLEPLLVLLGADETETGQGLFAAWPTAAVVCVHGDSGHMRVHVHCDDTERVHISSAHSKVWLPAAPRYRSMPAQEASPEPALDRSEPDTEPARETAVPAAARQEEDNDPADEAPPPPTGRAVRVRLFGPDADPELTVHGHHVEGLRSAARTLVAYLALHPLGADADQIEADCFGEAEPAKAYTQRRNAMHSLRHTLRKLTNASRAPVIIKDKTGLYRLDKELFDVDLWDFLRSAKVLRKKPEEVPEEQLRNIISIHTKKLLVGCDAPWVEPMRQHCTKEAVDACVRLAEKCESPVEKIQFLETAIAFDEYNEPLYRRAIKAHQESGFPEKAQQAYRALKNRLGELGEKPTKETRSMLQ